MTMNATYMILVISPPEANSSLGARDYSAQENHIVEKYPFPQYRFPCLNQGPLQLLLMSKNDRRASLETSKSRIALREKKKCSTLCKCPKSEKEKIARSFPLTFCTYANEC